MRHLMLFLIACFGSATIALLPKPGSAAVKGPDFPGWPSHFEGKLLERLPLSAREKLFNNQFPGRIARFSDGRREIILRWITAPSRKLHAAESCFRGSGYQISPQPLTIDQTGKRWGTFEARSNSENLLVYTRLEDDHGNNWQDVSAWYWSALFQPGPWWAWTVAEKKDGKVEGGIGE